MNLRPYQIKAIEEIRKKFAQGVRRVLLHLSTGGGKTVIFCQILKGVKERNKKAIIVVFGKDLIENASQRLFREGIEHGVLQGNHWNYKPREPIQVCSITTLYRRKLVPEADLVVIDECFTPDVEILTSKGFIRFDNLKKDELIAQVNKNDLSISFVEPTRWIENDVIDQEMIALKSDKKIDVTMTENHDIFYRDQNENRKIKAKDYVPGTKQFYTAGYATGLKDDLNPFEKLMIIFQADGHSQSAGCIHFQFSKQRKIDDFFQLMHEGDFSFREIKGKSEFGNVKAKRRFSVDWKLPRSKYISDIFQLETLSLDKCRKIIEYMVKWDGSVISDTLYYYSSVIKENSDFYQAIACLSGYSSRITVQKDDRKESYSDIYRLFIRKDTNLNSAQNVKPQKSQYTGKVYCVSVPEENIIIRRDGKVLIIGNCHQSDNESYKWLLEQYKGKFILPVTATPHLKKGMRHVADTVVYPTTFRDLVADGYLVKPKYYAPTTLDLSGVKIDKKTGDYSLKDLEKKLDGFRLYGDVVSHYKELCNGMPAICFAINISHSLMLCDLFNRAGIPCEHIDANTSISDRQIVYKKLETGELKVVVNVGVATTGVDIPCLKAIISCRPTKSYNLYIQMLGRGTRPFSGKDVFYVLDHANNILEHGMIEDEQECNLDGTKKDSVKRGKICERCFFVWMPKKPGEPCPECGHINSKQEKGEGEPKLDNKDAKLVEIKSKEELEHLKIKKQIDRWIDKANINSYKPGFVFHKTKDKYDEKTAKKFWNYIKAKVELHQDP